jgi:hypothetical protein
MIRSGKILLFALAFAGAFGLTIKPAAAVPLFYNTGEDIFEAGPLPAPFDQNPEYAGLKAGYKCDVFGLFWAYFWISNCEPVAFQGDKYLAEPDVAAAVAAKYPQDQMQLSPWQKFGKFAVGGGLLLLIALRIFTRRKG